MFDETGALEGWDFLPEGPSDFLHLDLAPEVATAEPTGGWLFLLVGH